MKKVYVSIDHTPNTMIIVANFGKGLHGECHKIQHIYLFLEKALKKIWQLEDILLLLVFNRKTSNVNMES